MPSGEGYLRIVLAAAIAILAPNCPAQNYLITTVAGGGIPYTPAPALSASLTVGFGSVAADTRGNVYAIAFNCIFKVDPAGVLTRVAGTSAGYSGDGGPALNAQLNNPIGLAVDGAGNIFMADTGNHVVRKVAAVTGVITTVAGNKALWPGSPGYSGDNGPATTAVLIQPDAVAVDGFGNLYIGDNYQVRKVTAATGIIARVAGDQIAGPSGDGGPATAAELGSVVTGVALDGAGNLYIVCPYANAVRKVTAATGIISLVAGNYTPGYSGDGGPATSAQLAYPNDVAVDGAGNIFIADTRSNIIRKVAAATGIITTVAGNGNEGDSGDGGPATSAQLNQPYAIALDGPGNIYIAADKIRKVSAATGTITTVAGNGDRYYTGDGGPANNAQLSYPCGVAVDRFGDFFIADQEVVRKVVASTGIITTVAGNGTPLYVGDGGLATSAGLSGVCGIAVDASGNLYMSDTGHNVVRKVTVAGIISTVAGNGDNGYSGDGGVASSARLSGPRGVAVDNSGNLWIADTGNNAIRKLVPSTGILTTVAGNGTAGYAGDGGAAIHATFSEPAALALDSSGNLYISDVGNHAIRKIAAATRIITTVAGGPAAQVQLIYPAGVAVDAFGNLYIADQQHNLIRKVAAATDIMTTVAGNLTQGYLGDGGPATSAELFLPQGIAVDRYGNVYIADSNNFRLRMLVPMASGVLLSLTKTHADNFSYGQAGAIYSVVVANSAGAAKTSGTVTVTESIPPGLTFESMHGDGWNCSSHAGACSRTDPLPGGAAYPPITVVVNVTPSGGPSQATNQVTLSGGGQVLVTAASDTTNIVPDSSGAPTVTMVSAASGAAPVTPNSIVSLYAADIAASAYSAPEGPPAPLPASLGGVSATVTDSAGNTFPIPLIAVTPDQVNAVLPAGPETGEATIRLVTGNGVAITGDVALVTVAPSIFTADQTGHGTAAAQVVIAHADGTQTFIGDIASCDAAGCAPSPFTLGSTTDQAVLELFGTGIRGAGGAANVTVTVGNTPCPVAYAGPQGAFYGLDQVNALLPRTLAGSGTVKVVLTAGGQPANIVTIDIQ